MTEIAEGWQRDKRVMREVRHHIAGALATEPAARLIDDDGRAYIALDDAQRIANPTQGVLL